MKYVAIFIILVSGLHAALSSVTVWEVRNAGNNNNGGGVNSSTVVVDYSIQNAAQYAPTDLAAAGGSGIVTSATAGFTANMVGNIMHITTTGTGAHFVIGFYEITGFTNATTVTLDHDPTTGGAGVAGTCAVGGALASIGSIGSGTAGLGAVAGNLICVKADSAYSKAASDTFSVAGTATNPIRIEGYSSTRPTLTTFGDGDLGRNTTGDGKLVTTNMPNYQYQATFRLIATSATFTMIKSINFSVAGAGVSNAVVSLSTDDVITNCVVTNPSTNTIASGINAQNARSVVENNDVFMTGASGGDTGSAISLTNSRAVANRVQMSQSTSTGPGISCVGTNTSNSVAFNVIIGNGGVSGINTVTTSAIVNAYYNTIVGFVDGIKTITGTTGLNYFFGNMVTENTSNAFNLVDSGAPAYISRNRTRDVSTITGGTNWVAIAIGQVTTDGGGSSTDYQNYGSQDLRLVVAAPASPAVDASIPASASMGALQPPGVATSGGQKSSVF